MPATPLDQHHLPADPLGRHTPLLPTVVIASFKGGVWKSSIAVAVAERLALAGLRVLVITVDEQEDSRSRLGATASDPPIKRLAYGEGSITVLGARGRQAIELLYRSGPDRQGLGTFDVAVLDTPPIMQAGSLPGVLLISPIDAADAARNLITMLRSTPSNTDIVLVKVKRLDPQEWAKDADYIQQVAKRSLQYLPEPLPSAEPIAAAHNQGRSVWTLPRRGNTLEFLSGVDTLAHVAWERINPKRPWPPMPPSSASAPYVPGWDDDA